VPQENAGYLLFGAKDQFDLNEDAGFRNTAYLLDPQGDLVGRHVKNHPVHFVRDGVAGTDANTFPTPFGRIGVAICFDLDYPEVARRLTDNGAEALLVPSDNPPEWGAVQHAQHRQMFQMRAVECGRWIATTDVAGNTFAVAPTGREVARVSTAEPVALDVRVGRETGRTLFVRGGWRFGQGCLLVLFALCVRAALPARFREPRP
jgi:apolipoprotein N-acyltransferase